MKFVMSLRYTLGRFVFKFNKYRISGDVIMTDINVLSIEGGKALFDQNKWWLLKHGSFLLLFSLMPLSDGDIKQLQLNWSGLTIKNNITNYHKNYKLTKLQYYESYLVGYQQCVCMCVCACVCVRTCMYLIVYMCKVNILGAGLVVKTPALGSEGPWFNPRQHSLVQMS